MPYVFHSPANRRDFLRVSMTALGTAAFGVRSALAADSARWAFVSDIHVPQDPTNEYRGFRPYDQFQTAVSQLVAAKPDGAVITGDLARLEGFPGDYANLKELLQPAAEQMPICMALGNHDDRENFYKAFDRFPGEKQSVKGKHVLVFEAPPVRFLIMDSNQYTNRVAGHLGKTQREWLQNYLQASDETPTLLFFHHTLGDGDGELLDVIRLFRIVQPFKKVKAIVFGHSHVYRYDVQDGIHLINLPATGYNFADSEPLGWVEAVMTAQGGDFTLRAFNGNREADGKTTSLSWRV